MYKFENHNTCGPIDGRVVPEWESRRLLILLMSIIVSISITLIAMLYFIPKLWNGGWIDTLILFAGVISIIIIRNDQLINASKNDMISNSKFNPYYYEEFEYLALEWTKREMDISWVINIWYATKTLERKIFAIHEWMISGLFLGVTLGFVYLGLMYGAKIVMNWIPGLFQLIIDVITNLLIWLSSSLITMTIAFVIGSLVLGVIYYISSGILHHGDNK